MSESKCTCHGEEYCAPARESYRGRGDWADKAADMLASGCGEVVDPTGVDAWPLERGTTRGRYFDSGAYRDSDEDKVDYAGVQSSIVNQAFGEYMLRHCKQADGTMRGFDNWKRGIPKDEYFKSLKRHAEDLFLEWEGYASRDGIDEALGGLMFNLQGFWLETLRDRDTKP